MHIYLSEDHRLHFPRAELSGGAFVVPFERPSRIEYIQSEFAARGMRDVRPPGPVDMAGLRSLHDAGYLAFLERAWDDWTAAGFEGEVIAANVPARGMHTDRIPRNIDGRVGYYCHASETAITEGTWAAALSSAASAQEAARDVAAGDALVFALCRPPGHHATRDQYGGYCFVNNAAIAAQTLRDNGAARVAILDIDFHHGNGSQDIFWRRGDVLFASLHGAPQDAYPYFIGYADETGEGDGAGANLNLPMPPGTGWPDWSAALDRALGAIGTFGTDALVVSLGVDAYKDDPIGFFRLESADFTKAGRAISRLGLPTVVCMEGGYAIEAVGVNTVNALEGLSDRTR